MNRVTGLLIWLVVLIVGQGTAETVKNIGLNVKIPNKWELTRKNSHTFYLGDTTGNFSALFSFTIYENIGTEYSNPRDWVENSVQAYQIYLESHPCFGIVYKVDTMVQDGLFGMFVDGETGDCVENIIYRKHHRFAANGNFGYELAVDADSLDMAEYRHLYLDLLDSVKIDRKFNSIVFENKSELRRYRPGTERLSWADIIGAFSSEAFNGRWAPAFTRLAVDVYDVKGKNREQYEITEPAAITRLGAYLGGRPEIGVIRLRVFQEGRETEQRILKFR